jgi:hypothetical protein
LAEQLEACRSSNDFSHAAEFPERLSFPMIADIIWPLFRYAFGFVQSASHPTPG